MSPEERNRVWESAAAQLGLSVVAEATKLKRRRNRIEGVIDGILVGVSHGTYGVEVSLTVRDVPYSNVSGDPVMDMYTFGNSDSASYIVAAAREAVEAFRSLASAPLVSRKVEIEGGYRVKFENRDSPRPIEVLGALGEMGLSEDGFIILTDVTTDEIMQSAVGESEFVVEYYDRLEERQFTTIVGTLEEALRLHLLWLANDPAWKTTTDWTPLDL